MNTILTWQELINHADLIAMDLVCIGEETTRGPIKRIELKDTLQQLSIITDWYAVYNPVGLCWSRKTVFGGEIDCGGINLNITKFEAEDADVFIRFRIKVDGKIPIFLVRH